MEFIKEFYYFTDLDVSVFSQPILRCNRGTCSLIKGLI